MPKDSEGREPNNPNYQEGNKKEGEVPKKESEKEVVEQPKNEKELFSDDLKKEIRKFITENIKILMEEMKYGSGSKEVEKPYNEEEDRKITNTI